MANTIPAKILEQVTDGLGAGDGQRHVGNEQQQTNPVFEHSAWGKETLDWQTNQPHSYHRDAARQQSMRERDI